MATSVGVPMPQSSFALAFDESACETRFPTFELGAPIAGATLYSDFGGECQAIDNPADRPMGPIGDEVPPSALAAGEAELRGEGRVQSRWLRPAGSRRLRPVVGQRARHSVRGHEPRGRRQRVRPIQCRPGRRLQLLRRPSASSTTSQPSCSPTT